MLMEKSMEIERGGNVERRNTRSTYDTPIGAHFQHEWSDGVDFSSLNPHCVSVSQMMILDRLNIKFGEQSMSHWISHRSDIETNGIYGSFLCWIFTCENVWIWIVWMLSTIVRLLLLYVVFSWHFAEYSIVVAVAAIIGVVVIATHARLIIRRSSATVTNPISWHPLCVCYHRVKTLQLRCIQLPLGYFTV